MLSKGSDGINILIIDAGGPRALSQLLQLESILRRYESSTDDINICETINPHRLFDMIGGSGIGGLIAILFIHLKMSIQEARSVLVKALEEVFVNPRLNPKQRQQQLREIIEEALESRGISKAALLYDENDCEGCKLAVPIMPVADMSSPIIFRNYCSPFAAPTDITIVEAALATCCSPPHFDPISVGGETKLITLMGADRKYSNPTREILAEALDAFGDKQLVSCVLSLGGGDPGVLALPERREGAEWVAFLECLVADAEKTAKEVMLQMGHIELYYRLSPPGGLEITAPNLLSVASTENYLEQASMQDYLNNCVEQLRSRRGLSTLEQLNRQGGRIVAHPGLPSLGSTFVMRDGPWQLLNDMVFEGESYHVEQKLVVISGLGGIGKTTLALKFATVASARFASVSFIDGSSEARLEEGLTAHVRSFGSEHSQNSFSDTMYYLSRRPKGGVRLMVFDNVDDEAIDIAKFIPKCDHGVVLITTRNYSMGNLSPNAHLELDSMSTQEAVEMLTRGSGRFWTTTLGDKDAMSHIAEEVGCHPIALRQAGSYLKETKSGPERYLKLIRCSKQKMMARPARYRQDMRYLSVYAAFDASYDALSPRSQKLLHLLSFFYRISFPLRLIEDAWNNHFSVEIYQSIKRSTEVRSSIDFLQELFVEEGSCDEITLQDQITALKSHSFITVVDNPNTTLISMHPLTHFWARDKLDNSQRAVYHESAVRLLACAPYNAGPLHQFLVAHIMHLYKSWDQLHTNDKAAFAIALNRAGRNHSAAPLFQSVAQELEERLGLDHLDTLSARAWVAACYRFDNRPEEAMALEVVVLERRKKLLGEDHPVTLDSAADLALIYQALGRYEEAESLGLHVYKQYQALQGEDDLCTINAAFMLATTYFFLDRIQEAKVLTKGALEKHRAILGDENLDTVQMSEMLALIYYEERLYAEAETLQTLALERRRRILGEEHTHTIQTARNLALTYLHLQRLVEAETLALRVLNLQRSIGGEEESRIEYTASIIAQIHQEQARLKSVEDLQRQICAQVLQELQADTIQGAEALTGATTNLSHPQRRQPLEEACAA